MANEKHLSILKEGVETWNRWRKEAAEIKPDLSGASLNGANLNGANFKGANLNGAKLKWANLGGAKFSWSKLNEVDFNRANLGDADLYRANLREAKLNEADFTRARLNGAILRGAKLNDANLCSAELIGAWLIGARLIRTTLKNANLRSAITAHTVFADVDLSSIKGLEMVRHAGPSTIGIDTIYRSGGNIPELFLKGCGVPDNFITSMTSLTGKAIEFYSLFISYSTLDEEFARRIHADLQDEGVRCWFSPVDIKGGKKVYEQIGESIREHEKLLIILSTHSMDSEWVKTEIKLARKQEIEEGERKLFPISLVNFDIVKKWSAFNADFGKDMAQEIREYHIPDFSNWKDHDSYKEAFERLLRALRDDHDL